MKKLALLLLTSLFIFSCTEKKGTETDPSENDRIENLQARVDSLEIENDSLTNALTAERPDSNSDSNYEREPLYDGKNLLRKGISNPTEFIENSLREQPELIPLKAVLGGTMRFRKIQLLSNKWVIASYDDGHIEGHAIYSYKLNKKGTLDFKLLDVIEP